MHVKGSAHYRQQYVRCGKQSCSRCTDGQGHGPYWYAVWREKDRVRTRYIGKTLPPEAPGTAVEEGVPASAATAKAPGDGTSAACGEAGTLDSLEGSAMASLARARAATPTRRPAPQGSQDRQPLRIWTLGRFHVERGGTPVPPTAWRRQSAVVLLKLLLLADGHRLPREHISAYLWPDADAVAGRENLSGALHSLRRALEPDLASGPRSRYLRQEGPSLVLHLDEHDWVDYSAFEALLAESGMARDPLPQLEAAAALYGGDLLPDEQDVWCAAAREALRLRWHGVLLALAEAQATRRQFDRALATLARLLGVDRTNEEAARRLMGMLARQGRRGEAMQIFNRLATALEEDLDAAPAPETESLFQALQAGTAPRRRTTAAARSAMPTGADEVARPRSPLIGRDPELARIRAGLEVAREGHHGVLLLAGDAGIGKTYLADEAAAMATILGYVVLVGYTGEGEVDLPYAAVAEALRCYTRTRPLAALRRELVGAEALVELLPELGQPPLSLVSPPPPDHEGAARLRLWNAALALLATATAQRPILLLLEDMHWADSASLGLITFLIRRGKGLRWLLLGTLRPEHETVEHPLQRLIREGRRAGTLELLELNGLSRDDVGEIARTAVGVPLSEAEVAVLHEQCAGNPLFVREVLNLRGSRDGASTDRRTAGVAIGGTLAMPHTIRQAFLQRIYRQSGECKALLQAAATIGKRFHTDLLAQILGQDPGAFERALDEAVESGLLREEPIDGALSLPHPLLQRTLYEEIAPSVRSMLHGRIATMLIERSAGHAEPYPMLLAYHFGGAREPISAARWLERAGDLAGEAHGQSEVMAQYEQALAAVDGCRSELLGGPEWGAWRSRLHEKLGDRLILSRGFDAAGEHYRQALGCIPIDTSAGEDRGTSRAATGEYIRRAELRRKEAVALDRAGNHDDALAAFAAAEAAGTERYGDESTLPAAVMAEIAVGRGRAYRGAGRGAEAEAAIRRALALLDGLAVCATLSRALSLRGQLAHERGEDKVAEQSYLDSLKIRERAGDQQGAAGCWYSLGTLAYDRGALPEAERCFERSLAIREALGDAWGSAFGWHKLGQIAQARASYGRAEECYRASLHIGERIGNQPGIADASFNLGQVARARADYAEAERCFRRSLAIQERLGDEAGVAASIGDIAEVARDRGELGQAESLARRSLATHERLHDQLGVATCLLNLGLIAAERGNYADALRDSRRARRLAHRIAAHRTECRAALAQAVSATQSGRHRLAAALLRRCSALNAQDGSTRTATLIHLSQGEGALLQDRRDQAREAARAAFRLAASQFRREEARAQRLLGRCEAAQEHHSEAERLLRAALATYQEIGASIEVARTQSTLALHPGSGIGARGTRGSETAGQQRRHAAAHGGGVTMGTGVGVSSGPTIDVKMGCGGRAAPVNVDLRLPTTPAAAGLTQGVPGDCGRGDGPAFSCAADASCRSILHVGLG